MIFLNIFYKIKGEIRHKTACKQTMLGLQIDFVFQMRTYEYGTVYSLRDSLRLSIVVFSVEQQKVSAPSPHPPDEKSPPRWLVDPGRNQKNKKK